MYNGHEVTYELKMTQCLTRNSTLWAEDPMLQLYYRAIARFSRKYFPYILNGMYITEEIKDAEVIDIPINPAEVITPEVTAAPESKKRKSKSDKLAEKFGVDKDPEEPPANDPAADLLQAAEVNYTPQLPISERINEAIARLGAPVTLLEVEMYMSSRGVLNGYDINDLEKYPENWRNRMAGDLDNLVNQAAEWFLSQSK